MADLVQTLIDHVTRGELLDLAGGEDVDEAAMPSWGPERTIHATVIRDILRGRLAPDPDPCGLRLRAARIEGRIDVQNLTTNVPLELYDCLLTEGVVVRDARLPYLVLNGCALQHPTESPLEAQRLATAVVALERATVKGMVQLAGAHISGGLSCRGAKVHNETGPALNGVGLRIDQDLRLSDFEATGHGQTSSVRLMGAQIGGCLIADSARVRNDTGPALNVNGAHIGLDILLRGVEAVGGNEMGAVRLMDAHIGRSLDCSGTHLRNEAGIALDANGLHTGSDVFLSGGFKALGGGDRETLRLVGASLGGVPVLAPESLEHPSPSRRLNIDGLQYAGLPKDDWKAWLRLLREATPSYAAQPYQQLAAAHRAAGHDHDARTVLIAQRRDQAHRTSTSRGERAWCWLTWTTLGYGYQAWRALLGLFTVVMTAILLTTLGPGAHGALIDAKALETKTTQSRTIARCTTVDRIGVGLDIGLPLIKTGARSHCETSNTATGQALTAAGWTLQVFAWAFATLFIAGFTGSVRKA